MRQHGNFKRSNKISSSEKTPKLMNVEYSRCWWFAREKAITACALPESTGLEKIISKVQIIQELEQMKLKYSEIIWEKFWKAI